MPLTCSGLSCARRMQQRLCVCGSLQELPWEVDAVKDDVYRWEVKLKRFVEGSPLAQVRWLPARRRSASLQHSRMQSVSLPVLEALTLTSSCACLKQDLAQLESACGRAEVVLRFSFKRGAASSP